MEATNVAVGDLVDLGAIYTSADCSNAKNTCPEGACNRDG